MNAVPNSAAVNTHPRNVRFKERAVPKKGADKTEKHQGNDVVPAHVGSSQKLPQRPRFSVGF